MPTVSNVTVLAPNGRRQNVKVTQNTTVLQVLEEVSAKHGFDPQEFDLRHHNHVLDATMTMRFSGLPNNAQLEMAKTQKIRKESEVLVSLQCESGDRVTDKFLPTDSLWDVVIKLCPNERECSVHPVIVYMRQEIPGVQKLKDTTLRSLGLTSGRAMMRFIHRSEEEIPHQANVTSLLPPRPVLNAVQPRYKPPQCMTLGQLAERSSQQPNVNVSETDRILNSVTSVTHMSENKSHQSNPDDDLNKKRNVTSDLDTSESRQEMVQLKQGVKNPNDHDESTSVEGPSGNNSMNSDSVCGENMRKPSCEEIVLLGERNALAFSLSMAQAVPCEDLPEDFFDLTIEDVRALFRDLKNKRAQMEEATFQTAALRELEESKRVLTQLNKYKRVVLRIQFPDRTVLQGTFSPIETIDTVREFVKEYLENPSTNFHLYTTPPKVILAPSVRLIDAQCVPSAVLHFGTDDIFQNETRFLREDVLAQFTSPEAASIAACQSRGLLPTVPSTSHSERNMSSDKNDDEKPSTSGISNARSDYQRSQGGPNTKVPKWFKPVNK